MAKVAVVMLFVFTTLLFVACGGSTIIEEPPIVEKLLPVVKTTGLVPVTATSVGVNVEIVSNGGEAITASGVCWVENGIPTVADNKYPVEVFSGTYSIVLTNLEIHKVWNIRAYATNKNGTGYGEKLSFSYTAPKAMVVVNPITGLTMTKATLSGAVIPYEYKAKVFIEYHEKGDALWTSEDLSSQLELNDPKDSTKLSLTITLIPGTNYGFRIKAINTSGEVVSPESEFSTYAAADFDGNFYHAVEIGGQTWLQENLQTTRYANGYAIVNVKDNLKWEVLISGVYSWYNDLYTLKPSGALYNYYAAISSRGFIKGWHVPTQEEWTILSNYLKSLSSNQATALPIMATGSTHWSNLNSNFIVTNTTGFTALPNGRIFPHAQSKDFVFAEFGLSANFWSASVSGTGVNYARIDANDCILNIEGIIGKNCGLGIRLIKDK